MWMAILYCKERNISLLEIDNHVALGNVPEGLDPSISVTSNHTFITDWNNSTDESIVNTYIAAAYGDSVFVAIIQ